MTGPRFGESPQVIRTYPDGPWASWWHWECRFPHAGSFLPPSGTARTWGAAATRLAQHHADYHGARGEHACPRCGDRVHNRVGDPERTDLCPPCTAAVWHEVAERQGRAIERCGAETDRLRDRLSRLTDDSVREAFRTAYRDMGEGRGGYDEGVRRVLAIVHGTPGRRGPRGVADRALLEGGDMEAIAGRLRFRADEADELERLARDPVRTDRS